MENGLFCTVIKFLFLFSVVGKSPENLPTHNALLQTLSNNVFSNKTTDLNNTQDSSPVNLPQVSLNPPQSNLQNQNLTSSLYQDQLNQINNNLITSTAPSIISSSNSTTKSKSSKKLSPKQRDKLALKNFVNSIPSKIQNHEDALNAELLNSNPVQVNGNYLRNRTPSQTQGLNLGSISNANQINSLPTLNLESLTNLMANSNNLQAQNMSKTNQGQQSQIIIQSNPNIFINGNGDKLNNLNITPNVVINQHQLQHQLQDKYFSNCGNDLELKLKGV